MSLPGFDELFAFADRLPAPVPVVAAGGDDPTVIAALSEAAERGWVRPLLSGPKDRTRAIADELGIPLDRFTLLDESDQPAMAAVAAVRTGEAQVLMKGQIATPELMKAVLDKERGLRAGQTICQIVLMEVLRDQRRFLLTDTGITIRPTLDQKRNMLDLAIRTAASLGSRQPKVAIMSATEKVNAAWPDTEEAALLVREFAEKQEGAQVQGPLSFDLAYAQDAGDKKKIAGAVTGAADVMLFPDLMSANLTVKAIMYTADCRFGGILQGAACPVVFMSRADSVETRLNSLAYAIAVTTGRNAIQE